MPGELNDNFDSNQIIKKVFESPNVPNEINPNALRVRNIGANLVSERYDEVELSYVDSGNPGEGEIETATYYFQEEIVAVLSMTYHPDGNLKNVKRTI